MEEEKKEETVPEEEDDSLLLLEREDGAIIRFKKVYELNFEGQDYVLAQPIPLLEGMKENEAICLASTPLEDGDVRFDVIVEQELLDKIFTLYKASLGIA